MRKLGWSLLAGVVALAAYPAAKSQDDCNDGCTGYNVGSVQKGICLWGTAQLKDGSCTVDMPQKFVDQSNAKANLEAIVTALDDCEGLFVSAATAKSFTVTECRKAKSDARFRWLVFSKPR